MLFTLFLILFYHVESLNIDKRVATSVLSRTKREQNFPENLIKDKHIRRECVAESCGMDEFFTIPPFKDHRFETIENKLRRFKIWKYEKYTEMGPEDRKLFSKNYPNDKVLFTANYTNVREQLKINSTELLIFSTQIRPYSSDE